MNDVSESFVLLEEQKRDIVGTQLLTRGVGLIIRGLEAVVGLDANGLRHLLIPVGDDPVERDESSQGVTLGSRLLRVQDSDVLFLDLTCRISALDLVFERLAQDIIARLGSDAASPVITCRRVLGEWRSLLKAAGQEVSKEVVIGLVGELEVLRLLAAQAPAAALDAWRGPSMSVHDFVRGSSEIEVKTTTSVDASVVSISNIDQVDPVVVPALHLLVVHAREDGSGPTLDERIDALIEIGVPRDGLLSKVADAGYVYESGAADSDRFQIRSVRAWEVTDAFPGIRRSDIDSRRLKGVTRIRFDLSLDAAPPPLREIDNFLSDWITC